MKYRDMLEIFNYKIKISNEINSSVNLQNINELFFQEIKNLVDSINLFVWIVNTKNFNLNLTDSFNNLNKFNELHGIFKSHIQIINSNINLFLTLSPKIKKILFVNSNSNSNSNYIFLAEQTNLTSIFINEFKQLKKNNKITLKENFLSLIDPNVKNNIGEKKTRLNSQINSFRINCERLLEITHLIVEIAEFNKCIYNCVIENFNWNQQIYQMKLDLIKKAFNIEKFIKIYLNYNVNIF